MMNCTTWKSSKMKNGRNLFSLRICNAKPPPAPPYNASPQALQVPEERSASPTASRSPLALTRKVRKGLGWAGHLTRNK